MKISYLILGIFLVISIVSVSAAEQQVRVIITVEKDFNEKMISDAGGQVVTKGKIFPIIVANLPQSAIEHIKNAKGIVRVEYDAKVYAFGKPLKNGKQKNQPPQQIPWGIERIKAPDAWSTSDGSSNGVIEVAVLDTGIDYDHPDLKNNFAWGISVLHGKISEKPRDYKDRNGHGTHVAGIIAALNNEIGVAGVAHGVELYIIKVLGDSGIGWVSDIILGIERSLLGPDGVLDSDGDGKIIGDSDDDAAEIISMSFGGSSDVQSLHDAIKDAYNYGAVLVAASGNDGALSPSYPAAYPEVIAVGATDSNDRVASWSNRGVEMTAPGVDILSTYPDDTYEMLSGTSMACPHVSGVVALIQATHYNEYGNVLPVGKSDDFGNDTVRGILHMTADDLGLQGWDFEYGYGIVRADLAVHEAT